MFLLSLLLVVCYAAASCVPFTTSTTGASLFGSANLTSTVTEIHIATSGFSLTPSSIAWTTGTTSDVIISVAGNVSGVPSVTFKANGTTIDVSATLSFHSSSSSPKAWPALMAATTATALLTADRPLTASLACFFSGALLANAGCTVAVKVSLTLPAGLGLTAVPSPSPSQLWYTIGALPTSQPTSPTSKPTKLITGAVYDGCYYIPSYSNGSLFYTYGMDFVYYGTDMTVELCRTQAKLNDFGVFVLSMQMGNPFLDAVCLVSNDLADLKATLLPSPNCNMTCPGDATDNCGGHDSWALYHIVTPAPSKAPSPPTGKPTTAAPVTTSSPSKSPSRSPSPPSGKPTTAAPVTTRSPSKLPSRAPSLPTGKPTVITASPTTSPTSCGFGCECSCLQSQLSSALIQLNGSNFLIDSIAQPLLATLSTYQLAFVEHNLQYYAHYADEAANAVNAIVAELAKCPLCGPAPPVATVAPTLAALPPREPTFTGVTFVGCIHLEDYISVYLIFAPFAVLRWSSDMTIDLCRDVAYAAGFQYFALRTAHPGLTGSIVCGGSNSKEAIIADGYAKGPEFAKCFATPCPGDPAQVCGGSAHSNVQTLIFAIEPTWTPEAPLPTPTTPAGVTTVGCYDVALNQMGDKNNINFLVSSFASAQSSSVPASTIESCLSFGQTALGDGLAYIAFYYGTCYVFSSLTSDQLAALTAFGPSKTCTLTCSSNPSQNCGGTTAFQLYKVTLSTSPSAYPSQAPTPPTATLAPVASSVAGFKYLGCFQPNNAAGSSLFVVGSEAHGCINFGSGGGSAINCLESPTMTVEKCAAEFSSISPTGYAMLYGTYCLPLQFFPDVPHVPLSNCNAICSDGAVCGGNAAILGTGGFTYISIYAPLPPG